MLSLLYSKKKNFKPLVAVGCLIWHEHVARCGKDFRDAHINYASPLSSTTEVIWVGGKKSHCPSIVPLSTTIRKAINASSNNGVFMFVVVANMWNQPYWLIKSLKDLICFRYLGQVGLVSRVSHGNSWCFQFVSCSLYQGYDKDLKHLSSGTNGRMGWPLAVPNILRTLSRPDPWKVEIGVFNSSSPYRKSGA